MSERRDGFARPNESPNGSNDDSRVARLNGRTAQRFIREETVRLEAEWKRDERWADISRPYGAADVVRLRGSIVPECTLARVGAEKLWDRLHESGHVAALGALTGGQAVQMAKAGLKAIYMSGWQVAADGNLAGATYPDQSLYPANSVPALVRRMNNALLRADQIHWAEGDHGVDWHLPIVADAEAGFGGPLNAFELMRAMIEAGAAGVHYEDQLSAEKKCGHLGGKVLIPTSHFIRMLTAARLGADVSFVCKLGRDAFGDLARRTYAGDGIDTRFVFETVDHATGGAAIILDV